MHVVADPDPQRFLHTDHLVWFEEPTGWPMERELEALPATHRFAVESHEPGADPSAYAAVWGHYDLQVSVPGPLGTVTTLPVPGLTWVAVHPDERRKGAATMLLRDHFDRARQAGHAVVALHASEPTIYGRHGYGVASRECTVTLPARAPLTAPALEALAGRTRAHLVSMADDGVPARVHAIVERVAGSQLGAVCRPAITYRRFSRPRPASSREREPERALVAVRDGVDVGVAWFARSEEWRDGMPNGTLTVFEMWGDAAAELALARRLLTFDLIGKVVFRGRGVDDRLRQWSADRRGVIGAPTDSMWVRLVDVPAALAARGYAAPADVVIEIPSDDACPTNAGRWRFVVDAAGHGSLTPATTAAEVTIDVQTLAAAYLGDGQLTAKLDAGLLREHRRGAVATLERAMAMPTRPVGAVAF